MMMLHEAIRLGTMANTKCTGSFYDPKTQGTCALGAGLDAVGRLNKDCLEKNFSILTEIWPFLKIYYPHPKMRHNRYDLITIIYNLNDYWKWSREEIATWLEPIEKELTAKEGIENKITKETKEEVLCQ